MTNRTIQRLSGFCVLGLAVALNVAPIRGQNNPTQTPRNPQTPQTQPQQQQPGARSTTPSATGQMSPSMFLTRAIEMNSAEIQLSRLAQSKSQNNRVESYAQMLIKDHTAALEKMQKLQGTQTSTTGTRQQPSTSTDRTDTAGTRSTTPSTGTPGTTGTPGAPGVPQTGQSGPRTGDTDTAQGGTRSTQGQGTADRNMPAISDEHQQLLTRLNGLSGSEFDREYINAMVSSHREAIRMFEQQAGVSSSTSTTQGTSTTRQGAGNQGQGQASTQQQRDTQGPGSAQRQSDSDTRSTTSASTQGPSATEVAALARELLPTLREHLEQAEAIQKTLK